MEKNKIIVKGAGVGVGIFIIGEIITRGYGLLCMRLFQGKEWSPWMSIMSMLLSTVNWVFRFFPKIIWAIGHDFIMSSLILSKHSAVFLTILNLIFWVALFIVIFYFRGVKIVTKKERSVGVTVGGWVIIITSFIMALPIFSIMDKITQEPSNAILVLKKGGFFGPLSLVLYILLFAGGIGVLKTKEWGRKLVLSISLLMSLSSAYYLFISYSRIIKFSIYDFMNCFFLILYLIIFYFFTRPKVKAQFNN